MCVNAQRDQYYYGPTSNAEELLTQQYFLTARGYVADPRFLAFDVTSSFLDYSSKLTMTNSTSSTHRRDWGYYNANAVLFPDNGFRLSVSSNKNRIESSVNSPLLSLGAPNNPGVTDIEGYGAEAFIPGNTIYPQITVGMRQESQIGDQLAYPVDQRTTNYNLKLSNANSESSQYNFTYLGYDVNDRVRSQRLTNHEFRLHSQSSLMAQFLVNSNAMYAIRNDVRNTSLEVMADDLRNTSLQHRVRVSHVVSSYLTSNLQRSSADHLSAMTLIHAGEDLTMRLGGNAEFASQQSSGRTLHSDEQKLSAEAQFERNYSAQRLTILLGSDFGLERVFGRERTFVHSSRAGIGLIGSLTSSISYLLRDDFNLHRQAVLGDAWGNMLRVEATWDLFWRVNLSSKFHRTDTRNLTSHQIPDLVNTNWENRITWYLGGNTSLMANYTRRASSSWFEDVSTRYMAGISQSELFPRLSFSISADQTYSTYSRQTVAHLEGELRYRFYAFSLIGRYVRDVIGQYDRSRFQFEIRRPIDVAFQ
ncbi:MAG: hypothetical protein WBQ23_01995 [Bacteroidota bacterium]